MAGKQNIAFKDEELTEQEKGLAEKIKKLQDSGYERKEAERELPGNMCTEPCRLDIKRGKEKLLNEEKVITRQNILHLYVAIIRCEFWSYESVRNILLYRIYTGDTETYKSHVVKVGSDRVKQIPEKDAGHHTYSKMLIQWICRQCSF